MKFKKGKYKVLHLGSNNPIHMYSCWGLCRAGLEDFWWTSSWPCASSEPSQQRQPATSWSALGKALPVGQEK